MLKHSSWNFTHPYQDVQPEGDMRGPAHTYLPLQIDAEKEYIGQMEKDGRAVIYPTACDGMRECDGADLDNRSPWNPSTLSCLKDWPQI